MSKHNKHHVKKHHWIDGALKTVEHFFDTIEEALAHANASNAHVVKVYNTDGELVHNTQTAITTTYA